MNIKNKMSKNMLQASLNSSNLTGGRRGCDHMLVGFTTTYAISAY
jgi:hypothetical protein